MRTFVLIDQTLSFEHHYQELPLLREIDPKSLPDEAEDGQRRPREAISPLTIRRWEEAIVKEIRTEKPYSIQQVLCEFHTITTTDGSKPPRFVVLGPPGSGKSTFLEYVEYLVGIGDPRIPNQVRIPLLIDLKEWERKTPHASLTEYLLDKYNELPCAPNTERQWGEIIKAGEALIALDGIDEVRNWDAFMPNLKKGLDFAANCPTIITGRTVSRARYAQLGVQMPVFYIGELSEEQRNALIRAYFDAKGKPQRAETLIQQLRAQPQMSALALNPLLLGLICYTVADERKVQLPVTRSEIYTRAIEKMLAQKRGVEVGYPDNIDLGVSDQLELLSRAALELFQKMACAQSLLIEGESLGRALSKAAQQAGFSKPRELATALKKDLSRNTRLLSGDEEEGYNFLHLTLLEYLAARGLALQLESDTERERTWQILQTHCDYPRWQEVMIFLAGCLAQRDQRRLLHEWIEWLADETRDDLLRHRLALAMQSLAEIPVSKRERYQDLIDALSEKYFAFWKELYDIRSTNAAPHFTDALRAIMRTGGRVEGQPFSCHLAGCLSADSSDEQVQMALEILRRLGADSAQAEVLNALSQRLPDLLQSAHTRVATVLAIEALEAQARQVIAHTLADHLPNLLQSADWGTREATVWAIGALGAQATPEVVRIFADHLPDLLQSAHTREATVRAIRALEAQAQQVIARTLADHLPDLLQSAHTREATVRAIRALEAQAQQVIARTLADHLPDLLQSADWRTRVATVLAIEALEAQARQVIAHTLADHLPNLLQSADWGTREATVRAIGALGAQATPEVVRIFADHLPDLLQSADWGTRVATVEAIRALEAQARQVIAHTLADHLPNLLQSADWGTREATVLAIEALEAQATPEVVRIFADHLPDLLQSADWGTRVATVRAIEALEAQATPEVVRIFADHLPDLLQSADWRTRVATVRAIRALEAQATPEVVRIFADHLPDLLQSADWGTREATVRAIRALEAQARQVIAHTLADHLPNLLQSADWGTRVATVRAIRALEAQARQVIAHTLADHLPDLLQSADWGTRVATVRAIEALEAQATPEVVRIFADHLPDLLQSADWGTREATVRAIRALEAQATPEVVRIFADHLPNLLQSADWGTCEATVEAIEALGAQARQVIAEKLVSHLPDLLQSAHTREATVRAIRALEAQATPEVVRIFADHLPDLLQSAHTREATVEAIRALGLQSVLVNTLCQIVRQLPAKTRWGVLAFLNRKSNIRFYPDNSDGITWRRLDECEEQE